MLEEIIANFKNVENIRDKIDLKLDEDTSCIDVFYKDINIGYFVIDKFECELDNEGEREKFIKKTGKDLFVDLDHNIGNINFYLIDKKERKDFILDLMDKLNLDVSDLNNENGDE